MDRKIEITYGNHVIDGIKTEVHSSTLTLENINRCNWLRSYSVKPEIKVYLPDLTHLRYEGSGNITCIDTLLFDNFSIDSWGGTGTIQLKLKSVNNVFSIHTGATDIQISGVGGVCYLYCIANGYIDCENYASGYSYINNSGSGDIRTNASKELIAKTGYIGDIYYKGSPYKIEHEKIGTGNLIKLY